MATLEEQLAAITARDTLRAKPILALALMWQRQVQRSPGVGADVLKCALLELLTACDEASK